jgi:uncharacterized damage-inducible protein DinB
MLPILRARHDELERQRLALLDDLLAHSPEQLHFHYASGAWSLAQLVEHLVLVEEGTLRFLTKKTPRPDTRPLAQRIRFHAFRLMMPLAIRVRVPVPSVLPTSDVPLEQLATRWDAARAALERYLEGVRQEQLRLLVFKHAFGGPLTVLETLDVFRLHIVHHGHQLRRIRSAPAFPSGKATAQHAGTPA